MPQTVTMNDMFLVFKNGNMTFELYGYFTSSLIQREVQKTGILSLK